MATIVLQAAGAFLGGFLGPVGVALGTAAGAMAGYMLDQRLFGGSQHVEGPRMRQMRPFSAEEGAPVARIYGTVRTGGDIIWATRFEETSTTERVGGKGGGPKMTTYSYACNAAFALCEGEIAGVRRIWADGREVEQDQVTIRIYRGTQTQPVDPLIAAKQGGGNAPAYRGTAYVVIERFPLGDYGNRIPQFQFEVMRPIGGLNQSVKRVMLLPGSTEYGFSPEQVTQLLNPGRLHQINRNIFHGGSDLGASLDELQALCPNLEEVGLLVTWFGSDLRAGHCRLEPAVMDNNITGHSMSWQVSGIARKLAKPVSLNKGALSYGGTPSDNSVMQCIAEIKQRGLKVTLCPFIMMDVTPGNSLPNPYGGAGQPSYPWRGRITCHPAPGLPGTADKTAAARAQVEAFCGEALPEQFLPFLDTILFTGLSIGWGYRRMILHYAHLAVTAGGVDGLLIGSELRGLTTLRDETNAFPFVEALCELAGDVRQIVGAGTKITYGADWSEYFGYQPPDGSGDVFFHLDALWSHAAIDAVGIDNYMPLSDWRDADYGGGNPDGFTQPYDPEGLRGQIVAGEGFDWYYASDAARAARERTPISDGAYGKPWVFRYKDLKSWWENRHFNRIGGVEAEEPTGWQPRSKPFWFTELGCPAVDKGPNQPNVFPDSKSSEDGLPYFSSGGRSDLAQARFLKAHLEHWDPASPYFEESANPVSPFYGGRMVDPSRLYLWAWDVRPFPAYPANRSLWQDGENWHRGHWLNGRLSSVMTGDLVEAVLKDHGLPAGDATRVSGSVAGYVVEPPSTARTALEPLAQLFGIAVHDDKGRLVFADEARPGTAAIEVDEMVVEPAGVSVERVRIPDGELPNEAELAFIDPFKDYQAAMARTVLPGTQGGRGRVLNFPGCLEDGAASALLADWVERQWVSRDRVSFSLPPGAAEVMPGSVVSLEEGAGSRDYLVSDVEDGLSRRVTARRIVPTLAMPWQPARLPVQRRSRSIFGAPWALLLDLPMAFGTSLPEDRFLLAAFADPWRSQAVFSSPGGTGFSHVASVPESATAGVLTAPAGGGPEGRIDHAGSITVRLYGGALSSAPMTQILNGANSAAMMTQSGWWEVFQFAQAEEVEPSVWRLGGLLRGQLGTGDAAASGAEAGASFVLLNHAVMKAGLSPAQAGLALNWRVGPAGLDFGGDTFVGLAGAGGVRARLPLSPVHLRFSREPNGDARLDWIRRGRIDADNWLGEDIPLGEESERYRVEIAPHGSAALRTAETTAPRFTYTASQITADFPSLPAEIDVTVRQIGTGMGAGLPASRTFTVE